MKLKHLGSMWVAAALLSGAPAFAANQSIDLSSGAASFIGTAPLLDGGDDVISFINLPAGTYDFVLSIEAQYILGLTASLNGQAATVTSIGNLVFAGLESTGTAPFALTLTGTVSANSLYTGSFQAFMVPEPATALMLLVGLGGIGLVGRRRTA